MGACAVGAGDWGGGPNDIIGDVRTVCGDAVPDAIDVGPLAICTGEFG